MFAEALLQIEKAAEDSIESGAGFSASEIMRLTNTFTKEREAVSSDYFADSRLRAAYSAHFLIPNAAKILHLLVQAERSGLLVRKKSFRILDFGCGPGTASLASSIFFSMISPEALLEAFGLEKNAQVLSEACKLFYLAGSKKRKFEGITGVVSSKSIRQHLGGQQFDIIFATNVLNEIKDESERFDICQRLVCDHLNENGLFFIVDPALHETSRQLMSLRDRLVNEEIATVVAPCLHARPCPMRLASGRDWCHFYIDWNRPKLVKKMDELAGVDRRHLKMSYLVLARERRVVMQESQSLRRVVSSPLVSKGKTELVLCGADGKLARMMRQDKNRSDSNGDFDSVKRGDIVLCCEKKGIEKTDEFRIVERWDLKS